MKQYWELKSQAPDALLLFRMGDFYELFGDDAVEAARLLELTLTSRDKGKANPMPMAGVPHHSIQGYLQRLLKAGRKVAIGEQVEDPAKVVGKAIVRREIVRIFSPGVQFDLEGAEANYLAAIVPAVRVTGASRADVDAVCVACLDASTGEALIGAPTDAEGALAELATKSVRQVLLLDPSVGAGKLILNALSPSGTLVETLPKNYLSAPQARELLRRHYEITVLDAFLGSDAAVLALGTLVTYVLRSQQKSRMANLRLPLPLHEPQTLVLGPRSAQHLDLLPTEDRHGGGNAPNLFSYINRTKTAPGARLLKRWLLAPLRTPAEIFARQGAVRELAALGIARDRLSAELGEIYDLERLLGRVGARLANPRDTRAIGHSLVALAGLAPRLSRPPTPPGSEEPNNARPDFGNSLTALRARLESSAAKLAPLGQRILKEQLPEAPLVARDGGIFARGMNAELDHLLELSTNGQQWLVELEARERESSGISSLKVRYNRVFGYYIEITSAHLKNVPSHYQRKQTMVGAERFFTEELKKFEEEILTASTRQKAMELELFEKLVGELETAAAELMEAAAAIAKLDALLALSRLASEPGWTFPVIDESLELEIRAGRHPLVDQMSGGRFVPNDLRLDPEASRVLTITGPNMGGKSTVMRQTALIVILGQMGAPVPAIDARWGVVEALYTRIGAHDAIAHGQSTFMVEMSELAHILHHANQRSLLILDEIGRGTSTYDGISVAWATLEWICNQVRARTLFATHYHELTVLAADLPSLANAHMAVAKSQDGEKSEGELRFLYQLREGAASESFGIHVARIAGLPRPIIQRAWQVLERLEHDSARTERTNSSGQLGLFDQLVSRAVPAASAPPEASLDTLELTTSEPELPPRSPDPRTTSALALLGQLEEVDPNALTPLEALNLLAGLRKTLGAAALTPSPSARG